MSSKRVKSPSPQTVEWASTNDTGILEPCRKESAKDEARVGERVPRRGFRLNSLLEKLWHGRFVRVVPSEIRSDEASEQRFQTPF